MHSSTGQCKLAACKQGVLDPTIPSATHTFIDKKLHLCCLLRHLELQPTSVPEGSHTSLLQILGEFSSLQFLLGTAVLGLLLPVKRALRQLSCSRGQHTGHPGRYKEVQMLLPQTPGMVLDKSGCSNSSLLPRR